MYARVILLSLELAELNREALKQILYLDLLQSISFSSFQRCIFFVNKPCKCGYTRLKKSGYTSFDSAQPNFIFQPFPPLVKLYWDKRNVESSLAVLPLDRLFQIFSTGTLTLAVALTFSDLFVTPTLEKDEESTPKVTLNTMKLTKTKFILDSDFQRIAFLPR